MINTKTVHTLSLIVICITLLFSCKTNKNAAESSTVEKNNLHLQLEDSLSSKYISNTYAIYHPSEMSPSNRTLNQYVVNFNCSASDFLILKELLVADVNVEILENTNQSDKQSSKSVKSAKTKSIRKNN